MNTTENKSAIAQVESGKKPSKISLLKTKKEMQIGDYLRNYILEAISIVFWVYTLIKLFVFDADTWVMDLYFPDYVWILNFKLIYVLSTASIIWLWIGTRDIIIWFFYVIFYPIVILAIKMPYFIFKQKSWLFAFAVINSVSSFFINLKYGLIFSTIFLGTFSIAIFSSGDYALYFVVISLIILTLTAYIRSFINALKPTVIFQIYSKVFKGIRKVGQASFTLDKDVKDLPIEKLESKQLEKWNTGLQTSVLFNRICLFTATKLRDYQRSEWRLIPYILGLFWLIIFTVVSFMGIYYSLFKIDPSFFAFTQAPSRFSFLYYSFNNLIFNSTPEINPVTVLSKSLYMLQSSLSFIIVIIFATLFISNRAQKSSSELDEVIVAVEDEAKNMESFIVEEYKITSIDMALAHLKEAKSGLVQFIYWFSSRIK